MLEVLNKGSSRASVLWKKLLGQLGNLHIKPLGAAFLNHLLGCLWEVDCRWMPVQWNTHPSYKRFWWSVEWKLELFWWEHVMLGQKKGSGSPAEEIQCNNYLTNQLICRCTSQLHTYPLLLCWGLPDHCKWCKFLPLTVLWATLSSLRWIWEWSGSTIFATFLYLHFSQGQAALSQLSRTEGHQRSQSQLRADEWHLAQCRWFQKWETENAPA